MSVVVTTCVLQSGRETLPTGRGPLVLGSTIPDVSSSSAPAPLRVGLVLLGSPPPGVPASEGGYLAMFGALLAPHGIALEAIDAQAGALPDRATATLDQPTDHELVASWIAHVLAREVQ
jgi:hypothetical protein